MGGKNGESMAGAEVLIVDDDPDIRESLFELLRHAGYIAATAVDGDDALGMLDVARKPCLVLLDWRMPRLSGQGFLDALQKRPDMEDFRVVVTSAHLKRGFDVFHPSVVGVLPKPFDLDHLLDLVKRHCRPGPS